MKDMFLAILAGLVCGAVFFVLKLEPPVPPVLPGIAGIFGVFSGGVIAGFIKKKLFKNNGES